MDHKKLIKFTGIFLGFMFYTGIIVLVSFPWILKLVGEYYLPEMEVKYWPMLFTCLSAGICGIVIVYQLRKIMKTVTNKDCFVDNNIRSLKMMGKVSFIISAIFTIKLSFMITPATFIIILTFFIAGLFSHVLSCVFQEAVRYKKENDLTI